MPDALDHDKRVVIYPAYINSKVTVAGGRQIPQALGCENPNVIEIADCCNIGLKLKAEYERKSYPRQWWVLGRVRVQLKNDDGTPCNPEIPNRKTLYRRVAELVPKHPGRSKKAQAAAQAAKEKEEREARAAAGAASGKSGKKGKKGRK